VRGDSFGTGVARRSLPDDLDVLWKYPAGKDAGYDATAVIASGVIYVGDSAGTFHAIRLADGSKVWTRQISVGGFGAGAAIEKGHIYVGDMDGIVHCLAATDGTEIWKSKLEAQVYAGPTPNGDEILFTCEAGTLSWLNKKDGQVRHTFKIEAPLRCTPTIASGHVVLAGCDARLHIINAADGKETDTVEIDGPTGSTPAMHGERVYFGTEGGTFFAIDISSADGKKPAVAWTQKDKNRNQPIRAAAAVSDQLVVYGSQSKAIFGLDPSKGSEKWKLPTRSRVESSPVIAGNRVVAATATGKIYLLDAANGEVKWEYEAGGGFTASPAVVDGRIILGNTDGTLYCFGSKKIEQVKN
jgi:outer membrane protein assembly factor BamB